MTNRLAHITKHITGVLAGADLAEQLIGNMVFNLRQGDAPMPREDILRNLRGIRKALRTGLQLEGDGE